MVLTALRGAVGFLTRLPVVHDEDAWAAFRATPAAFPLAGYLVGALIALPLLLGHWLPATSVAAAAVAWLYVSTGITHLDGAADLGDAAVVHGDEDRRLAVLTDAAVGVGGTAAVGVVLVALALAFLALGGLAARGFTARPVGGLALLDLLARGSSLGARSVGGLAVAVAVAAEVGAKLALAGVACLGTASHEGLGSAFTSASGRRSVLLPTLVALPAAVLSWPSPAAPAALLGAVAGGGALAWWANGLLGGVNGDVFGAANEVGRVVGLHAGVIAWTLS